MTGLYNFDLRYKGQTYSALVRVFSKGDELKCLVKYIERKLVHISAGHVFRYTQETGVQSSQHIPASLQDELQRCICEQVTSKKKNKLYVAVNNIG